MPIKALTWYQCQRFKVEQSFQEAKQELGMDDYQVRSWRSWHHHVTMSMLAMCFLVEEKLKFGATHGGATLRDIRELITALLPTNKSVYDKVREQVLGRLALRQKRLDAAKASPD